MGVYPFANPRATSTQAPYRLFCRIAAKVRSFRCVSSQNYNRFPSCNFVKRNGCHIPRHRRGKPPPTQWAESMSHLRQMPFCIRKRNGNKTPPMEQAASPRPHGGRKNHRLRSRRNAPRCKRGKTHTRNGRKNPAPRRRGKISIKLCFCTAAEKR